jgi:hypothetical protein
MLRSFQEHLQDVTFAFHKTLAEAHAHYAEELEAQRVAEIVFAGCDDLPPPCNICVQHSGGSMTAGIRCLWERPKYVLVFISFDGDTVDITVGSGAPNGYDDPDQMLAALRAILLQPP